MGQIDAEVERIMYKIGTELERLIGIELFKKEIELLKKENELLKKENERLKGER